MSYPLHKEGSFGIFYHRGAQKVSRLYLISALFLSHIEYHESKQSRIGGKMRMILNAGMDRT